MKDLVNKIMSTKLKYFVGAGLIAVIALTYFSFDSTLVAVDTFDVKKGEFIIDVVVPGELIAHKSKVISAPSNVRTSLQIVDMVPEGTQVKTGDFLLRFDASQLETQLIGKEDDLANQIEQKDEKMTSQNATMVQKEAQLQIQEFSHEQAKIRYELMKFEPEIKQRQQEIDMKKADLTLQEAKEEIKQLKLTHLNELRRLDDRIKRRQKEVDDIKRQIAAATINAPNDGLVVYRKKWSSTGQQEKVKVGDSVHRRQDIMEIPDLSLMKVTTAVNEVDISKIRYGQEVIITLDAHEGTYYGTVTNIARLARSEYGSTTVKVFDVEVTIKNSDENLKPGMSATCQVITDRMMDKVFVPLQSVFEEEGQTYVYVTEGGGNFSRQDVKTGEKNQNFIVINEGLEMGQFVTLRDPYSSLEAIGSEVKEKPKPTKVTPPPTNDNPMSRFRRGR